MTLPVVSPNTQAILLLIAPLIVGKGTSSPELFSHAEYRKLARRLHELQLQPANLLDTSGVDLPDICRGVTEESRLRRLLDRGFLLSQAIERWQSRAIWVISRSDDQYPRRLKNRLREDAPALLYGCGRTELLDTGGLAVVGSRHVDDYLIGSTLAVGHLTAQAGKTLVSGGAKGIDQAAMRGALEAGGHAVGVLADTLEKAVLNRESRRLIMDDQLALISPYDPLAGFNVGHAMQRNKVIYALADLSLVMSSDFNKGGTWAGAIEQLEHFRSVPVFVRSSGKASDGLEALRRKGAVSWPNPEDADALRSLFDGRSSFKEESDQIGLQLPYSKDEPILPLASIASVRSELEQEQPWKPRGSSSPVVVPRDEQGEKLSSDEHLSKNSPDPNTKSESGELAAGEILFGTVRQVIRSVLNKPMKEADIASALQVSMPQMRAWLQRLIDEDVITKQKRPMGYVAKQPPLFNERQQ
jgi:predicted Rossmann fold nucleotide-binding protein DprA/Smf involved in DNA uptake